VFLELSNKCQNFDNERKRLKLLFEIDFLEGWKYHLYLFKMHIRENEVTCFACQTSGYIREIKNKVFLVPKTCQDEFTNYRYIVKNNKEKNGFTTLYDSAKYLVTGSLFWILVMVGANVITSQLSRFKPGHGSFCMKGFKQCYREESYGWCADQLYHCFYENFNNATFFFQHEPVLKTPNLESFLEIENFTETEQKANEQQCHYLASIEVKMCETLCDNDIAKIYDCLGVCMALGAKTKSEYCTGLGKLSVKNRLRQLADSWQVFWLKI
jgi:hypothetical protein